MARQNRVTPFGEIVAVSERGTVMGNRGVLHDSDSRIIRPWQLQRWILCRLEFGGRQRVVVAPGRYTELFFLDEATGLAAGHRPCFECRRDSFVSFVDAWEKAEPEAGRPTASILDRRLHTERIGPGKSKQTFRMTLGDLPDGVFVSLDDESGSSHLIWNRKLLGWSAGGYTASISVSPNQLLTVLTPRSIVNAIRCRYVPEVHSSVDLLM